ncbi:choline dehydrogenase-like flavoprotein [Promicromonospora sp. AC04]|uniref:GMC oxidoreductase n=1 Tax=Promicromonospora sp. AC04 TaxID=2135723 RepID=UPI000D460D1E|nr:GMC oxidoreductase [Promicromonospora sp. AC04]PUB32042.1 choline dehydrogenase-like flavoprotein [Promicromonospora sp. AC04]
MTFPRSADVLIVGGGIMGSTVARLVREADPTVRIVMVDAGTAIGDTPGLHLHDVPDPELWERYNERVASGIQGMYTGASVDREPVGDVVGLQPGMFHALAFGEDAETMPGAAIAWNAGGMGVHWTAATPWPAGDEVFDGGDPRGWSDDLRTARRVLGVHPGPIGPTEAGQVVLDVLGEHLAGVGPGERAPQPMPMAVDPAADGPMTRTGPSVVFPPIAAGGDDRFELLTGALVTELLVAGDRVRGARVRRVADGTEQELLADTVVVCADALRTPQLLFASGIRPWALGRYLNEHAFVTGRVLMDVDRFGLDLATLPLPRVGEFCTDSLWLPQNGPDQPFHGQIMNTTYVDATGRPLAHSVGLSLYSPVESRPENRLVFSETETDAAGMPRISIEFGYSPTDLDLIDRALAQVQELAELFGPFDPQAERALLAPGSSLHLTGTVRIGEHDDGTSVADAHGRVWGFENLYVAGTGAVPTPVVANATLTGAVTAVRTARAVARRSAALAG